MNLDPQRWDAAIAALPGAIFYGLFRFAVILRTGQPVRRQDLTAVLVNCLCAVMAGMLLAFVFAGGVMHMIPWPSLRDPWVVGFGFGAFSWELLPLIYKTASGWAEKRAGRITGDSQ